MRTFCLTILSIVGFVVCLCVFMVFMFISFFGRAASDYILANAAIPTEREMPGTAGQIAYTSGEIQLVGGRGEGLGCSLNGFAQRAFPEKDGRHPIGLEMRQACAAHDYCYRHGAATYGYTQADCDFLLQEHAFRLCYFIERSMTDPNKPQGNQIDQKNKKIEQQNQCIQDARLVTLGVRIGGSDAFRGNSPKIRALSTGSVGGEDTASTFFEYDPYPIRSLSYAVYRIADAPGASRMLRPHKRVYKFSIRPSGIFVSVSSNSGTLQLLTIIPGDPAFLINAPLVARARHAGRAEDWFVWWQRRGMSETGGRILAIAPGRATKEDWVCIHSIGLPSMHFNELPGCRNRSSALVVAKLNEARDDSGFLQIIPISPDRQKDDVLQFMALQTPGCYPRNTTTHCFKLIAIDTAAGFNPQRHHPIPIVGLDGDQTDLYLDYAAPPFVFEPAGEASPVLAWLHRDPDYKTRALLRRIGIAYSSFGKTRGSVRLTDLEENDEPIIVLGRTTSYPALISFRAAGNVLVKQWRLPAHVKEPITPNVSIESVSCRTDLDETYLNRPPIFISNENGVATVVFSRYRRLHNTDVLQISILRLESRGTCVTTTIPGPTIPTKDLIPRLTHDDIDQKRRDLLRQTPLLAADLDADGTIEIVFPGAGDKQRVYRIGHVEGLVFKTGHMIKGTANGAVRKRNF